jgi:hypothetical protein
MCQRHESGADQGFTTFCLALRKWLGDLPFVDPPLAAAVELLDRRTHTSGVTWFECEVNHIAWNAEDMHAALGACVVLSLWNAARAGSFSPP